MYNPWCSPFIAEYVHGFEKNIYHFLHVERCFDREPLAMAEIYVPKPGMEDMVKWLYPTLFSGM